MFDIIIRNGTIATASDVFIADIGLRDGAIVQIGGEMTEARQMIDATGKYVLPGGSTVMSTCRSPSLRASRCATISKVAPGPL
ncbi:hypothetical protein ACFSYD_23915 [Paracoccus aerius]